MSQIAKRAFARSTAQRQQHNIGQVITVQIFGRKVAGKIMAVHPFGTVDIETSGGYYRVSGLSLNTKKKYVSDVFSIGGREYYRNKNGLCIDAPCCGCCTI